MDKDGLTAYERILTHFENMMTQAAAKRDAYFDELEFWTLKRENWMRRTMRRFEIVWEALQELYGQYSVFMPSPRLIDLWERAQVLAKCIGDFALRHDQVLEARAQEAAIPKYAMAAVSATIN